MIGLDTTVWHWRIFQPGPSNYGEIFCVIKEYFAATDTVEAVRADGYECGHSKKGTTVTTNAPLQLPTDWCGSCKPLELSWRQSRARHRNKIERKEKSVATAKMGDTISISYIGTLDDGTIFHSTEEEGPATVTLGAGELFPALEEAIIGMRPTETRNIFLCPAEAYGARLKENIIQLSRDRFPAEKEIRPGQKLSIEFVGGVSRVMMVTEVTEAAVTLDGNHPLAGFNLTFALRLDLIQ